MNYYMWPGPMIMWPGPMIGERLRGEVAMLGDRPLVVLLGEHATDQANDGGAVRKDADHIG